MIMAKATETPPIDLVAALKSAGSADLAAIDERITECERELAGLREAHRILDRRLNGPQKRAATPIAKGSSELACRIYDALEARGKATSHQIAETLGISAQQAGLTMAKCAWFRRLDSAEWVVAKARDAT
jgi:hypothetical protein